MVRQLAGEEVASLHLAHKHQSQDENLGRYTNPVRKKHFKALRRLERKLSLVLTAAGDAPWVRQSKNYMGKIKVERVRELRSQGVPPKEIAAKFGHLGRHGLQARSLVEPGETLLMIGHE